MLFYTYSPNSFEYLDSGDAEQSPLEEGVYLLPANATFEVPPSIGSHQMQRWGGESWSIVPDYRLSIIYSKADKTILAAGLGETPEDIGGTLLEPGQFDLWDENTGAWVFNQELADSDLLRRKQSVISNLINYRSTILDGGAKIIVSGADKWMQTDAHSRTQWLALYVAPSIGPGIVWRTMDGSYVTVTREVVDNVYAKTTLLDMLAFGNAETHRAGIMGSTDPESYDFSTGWPEVFSG